MGSYRATMVRGMSSGGTQILERFSLGCMAHLEAKRPSPKGS
jgi:hypothetical protein